MADLGNRGGLMGLEMPFDKMVQSQQQPQQQQAMGQPQMPPQSPQQAPQPPQQGMGQPTALGQPQQPQGQPEAPQNQPQQQGQKPKPMPWPPEKVGEQKDNADMKDAYNGKVDVSGHEVEVKDGEVEFQGKKFFVSNNGEMVIEEQTKKVVGRIENGKFVPMDAAHETKLREQKLVE